MNRPRYENMIPPALLNLLIAESKPAKGCEGLLINQRLLQEPSRLETPSLHRFVSALYEHCAPKLNAVLQQRVKDRSFTDYLTASFVEENRDLDYLSRLSHSAWRDAEGRLVVGPYAESSEVGERRVLVPSWLAGDQVTLFGPRDTEKMSINAMNALHHRL